MAEKTYKCAISDGFPNLILTANGPGELNGWVQPLLKEIRRKGKNWRISLVLWKTSFSAGSEKRIQSLLSELDMVVSLESNLNALVNREALSRLRQTGLPRALLHLGGEPLRSRLLALRLKCPAFLYSEQGITLKSLVFRKVFLSTASSVSGHLNVEGSRSRYYRVGNLFVDAVSSNDSNMKRVRPHREKRRISIGLFPGSRPYQIQQLGPLFLALCGPIARKVPGVEFFFSKSQYLSMHSFVQLVSGRKDTFLDSENRLRVRHRAKSFFGQGGEFVIPILSSREVFARSDLVVMLPGTATAEGMLLGVPMVVLAPSYRLGSNPAPIVPDVVDAVLGKVGKCVKQKALLLVLERFAFFSHPNKKAGREIVPELRGCVKPSEVVETVAEMAQDKQWRDKIKRDFKDLMGPPGAAGKIVELLCPFMERIG